MYDPEGSMLLAETLKVVSSGLEHVSRIFQSNSSMAAFAGKADIRCFSSPFTQKFSRV